jgi:hypothetical protein
MKKKLVSSILTPMLVAGAVSTAIAPKINAQELFTALNAGGTVSEIFNGASGITNGSPLSVSISGLDLNQAVLNPGGYYTDGASVVQNVSGNATDSSGIAMKVVLNAVDAFNEPCDQLYVGWGVYYSSATVTTYPAGTVTDTSLSSIETMVDLGLNGTVQYQGYGHYDDSFLLADSSGRVVVGGDLSNFQPTIVSEPVPLSLLAFGLLGLGAVGKRLGVNVQTNYVGTKTKQPQSSVVHLM